MTHKVQYIYIYYNHHNNLQMNRISQVFLLCITIISSKLCLHKYLIVENNYKDTSPIYQLHITSFE